MENCVVVERVEQIKRNGEGESSQKFWDPYQEMQIWYEDISYL